jgi:hypothetical protein
MFEDNEKYTFFQIIKDGKKYYRNYFIEFPNNHLKNYIENTYIKHMSSGDRIGVIYLKNISIYTEKSLEKIIQNDELYSKSHFIYLAFSYLVNNILYTFDKNLELESIKRNGDWFLAVYKKK